MGRRVVAELTALGYRDIIVSRSNVCDLTEQAAVRELVNSHKPDLVLHLAAAVGGIGANQDNPGKYFYDNMMMGVMLIEECQLAKVEKVVVLGTICAYPKFTPFPFAKRICGSVIQKKQTLPTVWQKNALCAISSIQKAIRDEFYLSACREPILVRRQFSGPHISCDSCFDQKFMDANAKGVSENVSG